MPRTVVAIMAVLFGYALWLLSMRFLHREPWDISLGAYCLALASAAAACIWLARPRRGYDTWLWPAWIVLGQLFYMLGRPGNWSLWPLALLAFAFFGLAAVLGAFAAQIVLRRRERT